MKKSIFKSTSVAMFLLVTGISMAPSSISAQADNRQQVVGIAAGDSLNVRSGPGSNYQDIGDIKKNQYVPVLGYSSNGRWAKVNWRGQEAWVSATFLSGGVGGQKNNLNQSGQVYNGPSNLGPHVVFGVPNNDPIGGVAVRSGEGTNFKIEQVIANTIEVFVVSVSRNGRWAFIKFSNGTGYVSTKYLKSIGQRGQNANNANNSGLGSNGASSQVIVPAPDGLLIPAVFSVSNVAQNDFLHGRSTPNQSASILKNFAPNEAVVVLAYLANGWVKIGGGEQDIFVNGKYLSRGGGTQTVSGMQVGLKCQGTEPFWTLNFDTDGAVRFAEMALGTSSNSSLNSAVPSSVTNSYPYNFSATPFSGAIDQQICSDGMSDIKHGWSIQAIEPKQGGGWEALNGCCNLQ